MRRGVPARFGVDIGIFEDPLREHLHKLLDVYRSDVQNLVLVFQPYQGFTGLLLLLNVLCHLPA